jgi:hypothetical protein
LLPARNAARHLVPLLAYPRSGYLMHSEEEEVEHSMAKVIRFGAGGGFVVEAFGLAMGEAKELAARLTEAGDPPGCSWCVGLEEEDEDLSGGEAG